MNMNAGILYDVWGMGYLILSRAYQNAHRDRPTVGNEDMAPNSFEIVAISPELLELDTTITTLPSER